MTAPKSLPPIPVPSGGVATTLGHVLGGGRRVPNLSSVTPAGENDIRQAMANASVTARNPQASTVDLNDPDIDGATIRLKNADVGFNPYQPRQYVNESYEEIRTSMKANGMDVALQVTRRGPGQPYFLAGGGNSRLGIAQDIFRDDNDPRFEYSHFIFKKWPGDRRVMASALSENLARSDLKFWEVARAAGEIIDDLEKEHGPLSERKLEELLPAEGIHAKRALIGRWLFTRKRLGALDKALIELTGQQVLSKYQPRLNSLCRLAGKFELDPEDFWSSVVSRTLAKASEDFLRDARTYDVDRICDAVEVALAERVGESAASIKRMLQLMSAMDGNVTLADLKAPPSPPAQPPAVARQGGSGNSSGTSNAPQAGSAVAPADDDDRGAVVPQEALRSLRPASPQSPAALSIVSAAGGAPETRHEAADEASTQQLEQAAQAMVRHAILAPHDGQDVRGLLTHELRYLVERVGIAECFVPCDSMPFGFFMEYPEPGSLSSPSVQQSAADLLVRAQAGAVFWTLQKLSGQLAPELARQLPPASRFYQSLVNDDFSLASLSGSLIGDSAIDDVLLLATKPGTDAMTQLLQVVVLMRAVSERYPSGFEGAVS